MSEIPRTWPLTDRGSQPDAPSGVSRVAASHTSPVLKVRSRLINFRVTDEEMERLKAASAKSGSRCLSDFARAAILNRAAVAASPVSEPALEDRLLSLERRLSRLESGLVRLIDGTQPLNPVSVRSEI